MLSERKRKEERRNFLTSKIMNFMVMTLIFAVCLMSLTCFGDDGGVDALASAKDLLEKGATAGGGLWAVWGLVQLGMSIKDHNGPGIQGAIWQIIGGAIIIAAGAVIGKLNFNMS